MAHQKKVETSPSQSTPRRIHDYRKIFGSDTLARSSCRMGASHGRCYLLASVGGTKLFLCRLLVFAKSLELQACQQRSTRKRMTLCLRLPASKGAAARRMEVCKQPAASSDTMHGTRSAQAEDASAAHRLRVVKDIGDAHCHAQLDIAAQEKISLCQVQFMSRHVRALPLTEKL